MKKAQELTRTNAQLAYRLAHKQAPKLSKNRAGKLAYRLVFEGLTPDKAILQAVLAVKPNATVVRYK